MVLVVKKKTVLANARDVRESGLIPGSGRSPGGGHGNPLQYSCLENFMRNLAGYSPWGCKELDTTEQRASNYKQRWWRRGLRTIAKTKCCFILIWECFEMKQSCTQKKYEDLVGFGVTALNVSRTSSESDYLSQVLKKVKSYLISFLHCKGKVNFNFKPEFLHWGHRNVISQVLRAELWDSLLLLDSNGGTKSLTAEITQRNHLIGLSYGIVTSFSIGSRGRV